MFTANQLKSLQKKICNTQMQKLMRKEMYKIFNRIKFHQFAYNFRDFNILQ